MAQEVEMGTSYKQVLEIAWRMEGIRHYGLDHTPRDKQPRYFGAFNGAPYGSNGQFMRGQSSRTMYSVPPPAPGAPARPYCSANPESTYHPPAIQGSSNGYSGHPGQTQGHQSSAPRDCYQCGELGHMMRFCPKHRGKAVQQGHQPMSTSPVAAPPVWSARGGGQVNSGLPRGRGQSGGTTARFYAFPATLEAVASYAMIIGIISIFSRDALILFNIGSTYSYVSSLFAPYLDVSRESLGVPLYVSMPVGDFVIVDSVYRSCVVTFYGYETRADLLLLDISDFEVILSMDWLSPYHTILDFHAKTVTLAMPELPRLAWRGSSISTFSHGISFLKARHMIEKGYLACLVYVWDTVMENPTIDSVPMVWEFFDVFPSDLPGMP
ncbi:uncharacterized protein [Nicotiana tomentosiformis]|uniref:uncharacterized protein n=1 Tax=Nicotiana tomentosiformis TaxID=4098 RepID=UPI00388C36C5